MNQAMSMKSKVVLLFARPCFHSHRERIAGVYSAAIERGWQIQHIADEPTVERLRETARLWNPIGCLIDPSVTTARLDGRSFRPIPTILMGRGETRRLWKRIDCSFQNSSEPVDLALAELTGLGLESFAFIGDAARPRWSVERGALFKEGLPAGAAFSRYSGPDQNTLEGRGAMERWLRTLPRPCGCFLAADHLAAAFYAAAAAAGLKVGSDLPTVGIDNDERCCLSVTPALTSVQMDFFQSGVDSIRLLERRLANPGMPPQVTNYGALGIVRRDSTSPVFRDHRVTKGAAFINARACGRLTVDEVAAEMGCCRRLAETLFRRHVGGTILDSIRKARMEKAFALLRNTHVALDAIPFQCGYAASPAYLKTYFKRVTGLTMREWRRRHVSSENRG